MANTAKKNFDHPIHLVGLPKRFLLAQTKGPTIKTHKTNFYVHRLRTLLILCLDVRSRNDCQRLCSYSLNFELLSKLFEIYFNHITVSPQNFGKSSTHRKSPFLEVSILGYGLSVRSHPPIHKNSNISTTNEGMFMKFKTSADKTCIDLHINFHKDPCMHWPTVSIHISSYSQVFT